MHPAERTVTRIVDFDTRMIASFWSREEACVLMNPDVMSIIESYKCGFTKIELQQFIKQNIDRLKNNVNISVIMETITKHFEHSWIVKVVEFPFNTILPTVLNERLNIIVSGTVVCSYGTNNNYRIIKKHSWFGPFFTNFNNCNQITTHVNCKDGVRIVSIPHGYALFTKALAITKLLSMYKTLKLSLFT